MKPVLFIHPEAVGLQAVGDPHVDERPVPSHTCATGSEAAALLDEAPQMWSAVLLGFDSRVDAHRAELDELLAASPDIPVICVLRDGDYASAARVGDHSTTDYIFSDQLHCAYAVELLDDVIGRVATQMREQHLQQELERRNAELLGLNALASAVSSSLSQDVIVRRALWVFSGLCRRGAAALVQFQSAPSVTEQADYGAYELAGEPPNDPRGDEVELGCVGEFAVDGQPICGEFGSLEPWLDFIDADEVLVLDERPDSADYPGIEPLLERLGDGVLTLVPIWGQGSAVGLLVLAELAPRDGMPFTREALRAMAAQLGGALENARLFEEVTSAYRSLQSAQDQLVHAEKFAAMGVLAAEIAHEINNPASFVISNLSVMVDYVETIGAFLEQMHQRIDDKAPHLSGEMDELAEDHEIAFLREDLDTLLTRSLGGMQRIHQIVQDLRFFSHDTANEAGWIDIESLLEATINLVKHEAKYRAQIELDFEGIPQIFSDANRLSQVFLNLLVNAAHAIESGAVDENRIEVRTRREDDNVAVTVRDTGKGIAADVLPRIFDPFFTTKEPGEGTGLGLSISRDIVRSLGGKISASSELGQGSCFEVVLPIRATKFEQDEQIRDSGNYMAAPTMIDPTPTSTLGRDTDASSEPIDEQRHQIGDDG